MAHSTAVKSLTYHIAYVIRDSEAATYRLLAGDDGGTTPERATRAIREVPALLRQLRSMTRDNADQQVLVGVLESATRGRITLMDQALARLHEGNREGARQSLRDAGDLFTIHEHVSAIVQNEDVLLLKRQAVATQQASNGTAVLMFTALDQPIDRMRGFASGADAYLSKGGDPLDVVKTVELLLTETTLSAE